MRARFLRRPSPSFNMLPNLNDAGSGSGVWDNVSSSFTRIMGLSMFASLFTNSNAGGSMKLFILGALIEAGRRLFQWLFERFRLQYSITAEFTEGDLAYDWIINFITQEKIWRRSRDFRVSSKTSQRLWGIHTSNAQIIESAEYVPTYDFPQIFWWNRHCIEIKRTKGNAAYPMALGPGMPSGQGSSIILTIYTLDMSVLSKLVEAAKARYYEVTRPHVIVHSATAQVYGPKFQWNNVKQKPRRPLNSIVLPGNALQSLIADIREFLNTEGWYSSAGIPHRRGYLLYGPPGTGKSSTIHAVAGELGMEIYSISLAANFVDDTVLEQAVSSVPKGSILLIEDIDCAFSREDDDDAMFHHNGFPRPVMPPFRVKPSRRSAVTLSGLLNILDGVGSEEGKLFFATTNYIDTLDPALLRPGRIDRKIEYKLATREQASALFSRFFPVQHCTPESLQDQSSALSDEDKLKTLAALNEKFTLCIPEHEFSIAELQGYLLSCKMMPEKAATQIQAWIESERRQKEERERRIEEKRLKQQAKQDQEEVTSLQHTLRKMGGFPSGSFVVPPTVASSAPVNGMLVPNAAVANTEGHPPPKKIDSLTNGTSTESEPASTPPAVSEQCNGVL